MTTGSNRHGWTENNNPGRGARVVEKHWGLRLLEHDQGHATVVGAPLLGA